jgi:ABC-type transport system substrate-binding protein
VSSDGKTRKNKDGTPLSVSLYYQQGGGYSEIARSLAEQWKAIGVKIQLMPQTETDFQTILAKAPANDTPPGAAYDILLYGISIGVDPDVYAYWDSSQIDYRSPSRLNFSVYKSAIADESLESGRTRLDPALRAVKYQPFLQAWQGDSPALGLYQPRFLYIARGPVYGLSENSINSDPQRFSDVHNWEIRQAWQ